MAWNVRTSSITHIRFRPDTGEPAPGSWSARAGMRDR